MASGSRTPEDTRTAFRAEYLRIRNASAAARAVNIPESTGRKLAGELDEDPEFVEACRLLRARALPFAEDVVRRGLEHALDEMAKGGHSGAAWFKPSVDALKALGLLTSAEAGGVAPVVTVNVGPLTATEPTEDDDSDS